MKFRKLFADNSIKFFYALFCWGWLCLYPVHQGDAQALQGGNARGQKLRATIGFHRQTLLDADIKDVRAAVDLWILEVGESIGFQTSAVIYDDLDRLFRDFREGALDLAYTSALDYLRMKPSIEAELGYVSQRGPKKTQRYLIFIHEDNETEEALDLRGKRLALKHSDEIGQLYLNTYLLRQQLPNVDDLFSTVVRKRTFSQVILSVFFGQADVGIAPDAMFDIMAELNPQIRSQLRIVASSPELIDKVAFFRRDYDNNAKTRIRRQTLHMKETARGRQVLMLFKIDDVVSLQESELDSLARILQANEALRQQ